MNKRIFIRACRRVLKEQTNNDCPANEYESITKKILTAYDRECNVCCNLFNIPELYSYMHPCNYFQEKRGMTKEETRQHMLNMIKGK